MHTVETASFGWVERRCCIALADLVYTLGPLDGRTCIIDRICTTRVTQPN